MLVVVQSYSEGGELSSPPSVCGPVYVPCDPVDVGAEALSISDLLPQQVHSPTIIKLTTFTNIYIIYVHVYRSDLHTHTHTHTPPTHTTHTHTHTQVCPRPVCLLDLLKALERSHRTVSPEALERYHQFTLKFGQSGT